MRSATTKGALPDSCHSPACIEERRLVKPIARSIAFQLLAPELRPRRRDAAEAAIVSVPEAAMNQHHGAPPRQDDVRPSGQLADVGPVPEPASMKGLSDRYLDLGIPAANAGHHAAAGSRVDDVGHGAGQPCGSSN